MVGLKVVVQVHNRCTRMCVGINKVNEGMGGGQQSAPTKWSRLLGPLCVSGTWVGQHSRWASVRWDVATWVMERGLALMKSIP